jgi:hypothetical protein
MVFRVDILVRDPEPVFDWTRQSTEARNLVRQVAVGVNYEAMKAGAIVSTCSTESPDHGWFIKTIFKDRAAAEKMLSAWQPIVARCGLVIMGDKLP